MVLGGALYWRGKVLGSEGHGTRRTAAQCFTAHK